MLRGVGALVDSNMRTAHGLALVGMENAILADIRAEHLRLYEEYAKKECDSTSGVDNSAQLTLVFGDFEREIPEDF